MNRKLLLNTNLNILVGLLIGIFSGLLENTIINQIATILSEIFINLLKLVSTPIIFFAILSTVSGMSRVKEFNFITKNLIKYTFLTTYIAALIAFILFIIINPVETHPISTESVAIENNKGYLHYLIQAIPSNIIKPFSENHVIGVLFLAILFSFAILALEEKHRNTLHNLFASLNALFMKIASWLVFIIPIAVWSFITLFIKELNEGFHFKPIMFYLLTIILANLVQGFIFLPLLIKIKGISPTKLASNMLPALTFAFFSKSSSATLPLTMRLANEKAGMSKKLSNLAFPLCTAINMNGCAAFILITVLFVAQSNHIPFSLGEMFLWTLIALIAALGNAGVPMGCYFLTSAFLAAMNVPLNLLAIILPFYALLDMLETAINVWSDVCVVSLVEQEIKFKNKESNELIDDIIQPTL